MRLSVLRGVVALMIVCVLNVVDVMLLVHHRDGSLLFPARSSKTTVQLSSSTPTHPATTHVVAPTAPTPFVMPVFKHPSQVFVHARTPLVDVKPPVAADGVESVVNVNEHTRRVSFVLTRDRIPLYPAASSTLEPVVYRQLSTRGARYGFARDTWNDSLRPLLIAMADWVTRTSTPVMVKVTFDRGDAHDMLAQFVDVSAFSLSDGGKALNVNVSLYQYDHDGVLDYATATMVTSKGGR